MYTRIEGRLVIAPILLVVLVIWLLDDRGGYHGKDWSGPMVKIAENLGTRIIVSPNVQATGSVRSAQ
jgi:hypothetical protein